MTKVDDQYKYQVVDTKVNSMNPMQLVDHKIPKQQSSAAINFYEGVAPVLEGCGETIKKLVLENIPEIDISVIGEKCKGLRSLALSGTTTYRMMATHDPNQFRSLKNLELWDGSSSCCHILFNQRGFV